MIKNINQIRFFPEILNLIKPSLPIDSTVYLVGGAVRDAIISRTSHDLDFACDGDAYQIARQVAKGLNVPFYVLDPVRGTVRVIYTSPDGNRKLLDFAQFRGNNLISDLKGRDFTINAIAVAVNEMNKLIDPLNGLNDLKDGVLRVCSTKSFLDDPIRILRAIRQAIELNFKILVESKSLLRQSVDSLNSVSSERLRDELFRMFDLSNSGTAIRALDRMGALSFVLPEMTGLKNEKQPPPHITDAWTHTLDAAHKLTMLFNVLSAEVNPKVSSNWTMGMVSLRLGRFRQMLEAHLQTSLNPDRSLKALIQFACLYHDIGKPLTRSVKTDGAVHYQHHEIEGAKIVSQRATQLNLSNPEISRLQIIIKNHMRPFHLANSEKSPSRRAIYRFFRDCGEAGVDICMIFLADSLATYGPTIPQAVWDRHINVVRMLWESWWERPTKDVSPPLLLSGNDLMDHFDLEQGPQIGQLLEMIRESQAMGDITNRDQAIEYVRMKIDDSSPG